MALFGLFGVAVAGILADLLGSARTRPFTRFVVFAAFLEAGGLGPAAWIRWIGAAISHIPNIL